MYVQYTVYISDITGYLFSGVIDIAKLYLGVITSKRLGNTALSDGKQ